MASAAEQLASNMSLSAFSKASDLKKRLLFTLAILVVYRIGTFVPVPGIDAGVLGDIFQQQFQGGIVGWFNTLAGGAVERMSIFALNIMPYISAAIIMQLMTAISPSIAALKKEGEQGRKKINQYTRQLTIFIAAVQAYGIAVGLEALQTQAGLGAVFEPGLFFRFTAVVTLVGGTVFLMWLGEQVTARGVGNGISLIIFAGIVAGVPSALAQTLTLGRQGSLSELFIIFLFVLAVAVIYFVVFVERAQRRIVVQYPKRQVGNKMMGGESSHLPLKLNTSGVIPPIFASSILLMPLTVAGFSQSAGPGWLQTIATFLQPNGLAYSVLFAVAIVFFAFFYTSVVFNPEETADNLKKYGGFIPGIRPGENTARYLDYVLTRLTVVGSAYLVVVCLLPIALQGQSGVPFYFGGTSLLIVVTVTMDTVAQIQSHLVAHQYEGLLKRTRFAGRRR